MAVDRLHSLVATGQFLAAYREVERLALDPDLDPSDRAKVYIVGIRAAAGLCDVYAGAKMAEKAIQAAELGSNWEDVGDARLHAALIYVQLGDAALALRYFQLFFEYLDRYPALQAKTAYAYYNRALVHQQRREYAEALEDYKLAAEDFEKLKHQPGLLTCLHNSAWILLQQGRTSDAEPLLSQAEALLAAIEGPEYQVQHIVVEAFYARQTNSPQRAMELCEEIFQAGRPGVSDRHLGLACWLMADVALDARRLEQAAIFSQLAVKHALEAKEPGLMNLASEVRQRVEIKKSELRS